MCFDDERLHVHDQRSFRFVTRQVFRTPDEPDELLEYKCRLPGGAPRSGLRKARKEPDTTHIDRLGSPHHLFLVERVVGPFSTCEGVPALADPETAEE